MNSNAKNAALWSVYFLCSGLATLLVPILFMAVLFSYAAFKEDTYLESTQKRLVQCEKVLSESLEQKEKAK